MRNVAKGDVTKLCEHTRELMFELNAAGVIKLYSHHGLKKVKRKGYNKVATNINQIRRNSKNYKLDN